MSWLQLSLRVDGEQAEQAIEELEALGAVSVTLEDAEDSALFEPAPGETPLWPSVVISGLFESDRAQQLDAIRDGGIWASRQGFHLSRVADKAWEREWLKDFEPLRFGRHLWVCPADLLPEYDEADVILKLDPGLAFGTGTHATTALCLDWLDLNRPKGMRVVDFGCGSGILSIAAALLGATMVDAVDIDPQALEATRLNAMRNQVADRIRIGPAADPVPGCDLLIANILAGTLIDLAPRFAEVTEGGAHILLSGILAGQATAVIQAYAPWFDLKDRTERDGWILLAGRRLEAD